ncbi:MAG: alanine racemase [Selenomonadaceae bacterium]|nr:alanine racemase [Selenomonadaceae bacterium]MBP3721781.1 alanine racemase [Selenomonadaceae bacterium]
MRDAWAKINLSAIRNNFQIIMSKLTKGTKLCAVVKANAYGHGAEQIARVALDMGAYYLAVATVDEGVELRKAGITAPILILGLSPKESANEIVYYDLTQGVAELSLAEAISRAASEQGKIAKLHLKAETGMGRIGANAKDAPQLAKNIAELENIELEGIYSHFAAADEKDKSFVKIQLEVFTKVIENCENLGVKFKLRHIAESAAILEIPEAHLDMARAGIIEYGLFPSAEVSHSAPLKEAFTLQAKIVFLKTIEKGESVGYGREFIAKRKSKIATLPIGYADGYIRAFKKGEVSVRGKRCKIAGRVCMDQVMIDVTDVPDVAVGDIVTLFGGDIPIDEAAGFIDTINYELPCLVGGRVPRVYVE